MKVSIVIPVYNVEKYLTQCLDSAVNQTLDDIEIICINDGSTDNSLEILNQYSKKYSNIKIINQENKGLGLTRNVGIETATGEYIYFLDSDDYIELNSMKICYDEATSNKLDVLTFDANSFCDKSLNIDNINENYDRSGLEYLGIIDGREFYIKSKKTRKYRAPVWLNFYKTDFIKTNNLLFEDTLHEDEIHTVKVLLKAKRVKYINKKLFNRRLRANSIMTGGITDERIYGNINIVKSLIKQFKDELYSTDKELVYLLKEDILIFIKHIIRLCDIYNKLDIKNKFLNMLYESNIDKDIDINLCINKPNLIYYKTKLRDNKSYEFNNVKRKKNTIYFMLVPEHGNLGDQTIVYATLKFLEAYYKSHDIITIPFNDTKNYVEIIKKFFKVGDFIVLPGGGNMGDHYIWEEDYRRYVIQSMNNFPIVSFPQTIYFSDTENGKEEFLKSTVTYGLNKKLLLIAREQKSYEIMKNSFVNKILLYPDIVFYLYKIVRPRFDNLSRNQIMTCFRKDKETYFSLENKQELIKNISDDYNVFVYDTIVDRYVSDITREKEINYLLDEYYKSKVVITDRLHGMIFAFITKTPCIVLRSFDYKVIESYKWIENIDYIKFTNDISYNNVKKLIKELENIRIDYKEDIFDNNYKELKNNIDNILCSKNEIEKSINGKIVVKDIIISQNYLEYIFDVSEDIKRYFRSKNMKIEYDSNIEGIPSSISVIPLVCNLIPIAWFTDSEIIVDEIDEQFYYSILDIKKSFEEMYEIKLGGKLIFNKLVYNNIEIEDEKYISLFSGGVDSLCTAVDYKDKNLQLATIWGSDINIFNKHGWNNMKQSILESSSILGLDSIFIKSDFRLCIDEFELNKLLISKKIKILRDNQIINIECWWLRIQHGISLISHLVPYAYKNKIKTILVPGSVSEDFTRRVGKSLLASDPSIDDKFKFSSHAVFHHGFNYERHHKINRIIDNCIELNRYIPIKVCYLSADGNNCSMCPKCIVTIISIILRKADPNKFGFIVNEDTLNLAHNKYINEWVFNDNDIDRLRLMKLEFNKERDFWIKYDSLKWILDMDVSYEFNEYKK